MTTAATPLNVWTASKVFGSADRVPSRLRPTDVPHIRRCIEAGLVAVDGRELVLTDAGRARLAEGKK